MKYKTVIINGVTIKFMKTIGWFDDEGNPKGISVMATSESLPNHSANGRTKPIALKNYLKFYGKKLEQVK